MVSVPEHLKPPPRDDVRLVRAETIGESYGRLLRYVVRFRRFDGTWSEEAGRDCFDSGHAVIVVPYDPVADEVVLIRQFRIAPYLFGGDPWMWECVAGRIDKARATAETTAHEEGREEAGLRFRHLAPIPPFFTSPGIFSERLDAFCGIVEGRARDGVFGLDHEQEDIKAEVFAAADAFALARGGGIVSGPTLVCLYWLELNRDRLRKAWA